MKIEIRYHKKCYCKCGESYCHDGETPPNVVNKIIYIVDFCFKKEYIIEMAKVAKQIIIIDHHDTCFRQIEEMQFENVKIIFDSEKSAAQLVWDFFYPGKTRPWFIDVIADRDLWDMKLENTGPLTRAMFKLGYYRWNMLEKLFKMDPDSTIQNLLQIGIPIYESDRIEMLKIASKAVKSIMTTPKGDVYNVYLVPCFNKMLKSDVGNYLALKDCDFAVLWYYDFTEDSWWMSTRASRTCTLNLAEICEQFWMGGGHTKAAGFAIGNGENLHTYFEAI